MRVPPPCKKRRGRFVREGTPAREILRRLCGWRGSAELLPFGGPAGEDGDPRRVGTAASGSYARLGSRSGSLGLGRRAGGATGLTFWADEIVGTKLAGPIKEGRPAIGFRQTDAKVAKSAREVMGRDISRVVPPVIPPFRPRFGHRLIHWGIR